MLPRQKASGIQKPCSRYSSLVLLLTCKFVHVPQVHPFVILLKLYLLGIISLIQIVYVYSY